MASGYKNPPSFCGDSSDNYDTWKNEIAVWQLMTDVVPEKQALAVTLTLKGQARAKALEIEVVNLNKTAGMKTLITALDTVFLRDKVDRAYGAYKDFDIYTRPEGVTISEYVIEFERLYNKCKINDMALPDAVLAFKMLDNSKLSEKERQLALTAASDLQFSSMKSAMKRIFGGSDSRTFDASHGIQVKQESAMYTNYRPDRQQYQGQGQKQRKKVQGTNPVDKFGRVSKCAICQSTFHWAKKCPHRSTDRPEHCDVVEKSEDCNITVLYTEADPSEILMTEAYGHAVIDTACTKTVCGKEWLDNYIEKLDETEKKQVRSISSDKSFRFGDGVQVTSINNVTIPANIGGTPCQINTEVVDTSLPLLLSKASLKKADTVLDLSSDQAKMFDKPVKLEFTSSGHYCVGLLSKRSVGTDLSSEEVLVVDRIQDPLDHSDYEVLLLEDKSEPEKRKILVKLHKQFGHAHFERLKRLLQSAGVRNSEVFTMLKEITETCELCLKWKRTSPKPAVGFPLAVAFNETVAADLHELGPSLWYLHMIDEFTRFSAATVVRSKATSLFVKMFIQRWIAIFGAPRKLFSDNGGEFNSNEVRDLAENFNIEVKTTPAYSPWSNGLMEKHNDILTVTFEKIRAENDVDIETALQWAVVAKNSLSNVHGFSAHQLVFGQNPNLPSVLLDRLPALEGTTVSKTVAENITALYAARKAFTEAENSDRIRRALRKQTRPFNDHFQVGDKVFYKRPDSPKWRGPGVVIGQDGVVMILRHGGMVIRAHRCRLGKISKHGEGLQTVSVQSGEERGQNNDADTVADIEPEEEDEVENPTHEVENQTGVDRVQNEMVARQAVVKKGDVIKFNLHGDNKEARVLDRAGKASGKYKSWYNVQYKENDEDYGEPQSVDLGQVMGLEVVPRVARFDVEEEVLVTSGVSFVEAKQKELHSWKHHGVFETVPDLGQKAVSTKWVCTMKETSQGVIPKARLVARGFEEIDENIQKDSPTCSHETFKVVLTILAQKNWTPHSMDIKTAFLQGHPLEREIFLNPPKEGNCPGKLWHLKKCVYGLGDASLYWYRRVKSCMEKLGARVSKLDPALFYWFDGSELIGVLVSHVDDFLWGGTPAFVDKVIERVKKEFVVGSEEVQSFKYVGLKVTCREGDIMLDQNLYVSSLSSVQMTKERAGQKDDSLTDKEKTQMRAKIGQMLWVARQTRPDIIFETCELAAKVKNAKVRDLEDTNKVMKRLINDRLTLKFQKLYDPVVLVYSDSSLGNLPNGGTQGGHFVCLRGEGGQICPLSWSSRRIKRVVRSTLAGETLAMADGIDTAIYLASLYSELMFGKPDPQKLSLLCVTDCKSLYEAVRSTKTVTERRLRLDISGICNLIQYLLSPKRLILSLVGVNVV